MLKLLHAIGFAVVCATPHQKAGFFVPSDEEIAARYTQVSARLMEHDVTLPLYLAAENYWDDLFLGRAQAGTIPMYRLGPAAAPTTGSAQAAFLFELPVEHLPLGLEQQLFALRLRGYLPVLAHPERYVPLWGKRERIEALARCAALVIDLAALDGAHGPQRGKAARYLVQEGLCHAAASDVHQSSDVRAVAAGMHWIRKKFGASRIEALLSDGPRQILAGELPDLPVG